MKSLVLILALTFFAQSQAPVGSLDDVKSFTRGWLIGVFNQDVAGNVIECLELETLEDHIQKAVEDFKEKTALGIRDGVIELFELFVALPQAIDKCLSEHDDVMAMMKSKTSAIISLIQNPDELWKQILQNTLTNGITIFKDIGDGIGAIKAKNWQEAGKDFGDAADLAMFGATQIELNIDLENAKEFMRGWLIGVFDQDVAAEAVECLDLQDLIIHVDNAINDFNKKTTSGVVEGLVELLDIYLALPKAIDSCLSSHGDIAADMKAHVDATISYIKDPSQLTAIVTKNLLLNGITIFKDVDNAFKDINAGNWRQAGLEFGDAVDLTLFGQLGGYVDQIKSFLKGMMEGFFHEDIIQDVVECMDIASLEQHLANALESFKEFTLQGILDGIKELIALFSNVESAVNQCITEHADIRAQILNKIKTVKSIIADPSRLQQLVMVNIEKYGLTIFQDLKDVYSAIKSQNWHQAGFDFGQVIDLLLFGGGESKLDNEIIEDIEEFTKGLLVGIFKDEVVTAVTGCMNFEAFEQHIINAYKDFDKFNLQGFEDGFMELLALLTETKKAATDCLHDNPDLAASVINKIEVTVKIIKDKSQLEKLIMQNINTYGLTVANELKDLKWAIQNKQWYQAGHDMGDIVNCLIYGNKLGMTHDQINAFIKGWLIGMFQEDVAADITECLQTDVVFQHLEAALAAFKEFSLDGLKQGMAEIFQIIGILPGAIDTCLTEHEDVAQKMKEKIAEIEGLIKDPSQLLSIIETNFKSHAFTLVKDIMGCLYSLHSGNYQAAGQDLGEVVNLLLFGGNKTGVVEINLKKINLSQ